MVFNFILIGLIFTTIVWVFQRPRLIPIIKIPVLSILTICFGMLLYFVADDIFLGDEPWYQKSPFKELILFFLMLFGMVARYMTKTIDDRRNKLKELMEKSRNFRKPKLNFDIWEFSYPLFFSVITFGSLLSQIKGDNLSLVNIILSFQTGFFWQTLLNKEAT